MLNVTVLEDVELSTLIKAMHEARFAESPLDPIVWLNPFVIDLHGAALKECGPTVETSRARPVLRTSVSTNGPAGPNT